jgi:hypothetical protein
MMLLKPTPIWDGYGRGRGGPIAVIADIARVIAGIGKTLELPLINTDYTDPESDTEEGAKRGTSGGA